MTTGRPAAPRRSPLILAVATVLAALALFSLGTWQLERKAWKEALIDTLARRLAAEPGELPARVRWDRLDPANEEFRRVTFPAELLPGEEALVYASGAALRADVTGPGYWVFAPARLPGGSLVIVNRGFVPEGRQDPGTLAAGRLTGVVDIVGALRWPEPRSWFTPKDSPEKNLWFVRDSVAIAAAKGWAPVAPFYVEQEAPPVPAGLPRVGRLRASLPNNHLQYAVTWYGLTVVLIVVFGAYWRSQRRKPETNPAN